MAYYPNKQRAFATAVHHLRHIAQNSIGETLGFTQDEKDLYNAMRHVMASYRHNAEINHQSFIEENFTNTEPVELKRLLKGKNEK